MLRKRLVLLRKRAHLSFARFDEHWRSGHADLVAALPRIREYVQNPVEQAWSADAAAPMVHGIVEVWFDDSGLTDPAHHTSPAQQEDEPHFVEALTGYTVWPRDTYEAAAKVWVLATPGTVRHLAHEDEVGGARSLAFEPEDGALVPRPRLAREATASSGVIFPCASRQLADDLFTRVVQCCTRLSGRHVRVLVTHTRRIL